MNEAESPQRKKFARKWLALCACTLLLGTGFIIYGVIGASGTNKFLNKTVLLTSKTIRDVFGLGTQNKFAAEIDLGKEEPALFADAASSADIVTLPPAPEQAIARTSPPGPAPALSRESQLSPSPVSHSPNHIVISAVQISGSSSTDDFIKIYNPTSVPINIGGWKLRKKTSTGNDDSVRVFASKSAIEPFGYFLWANSYGGFALSIGANESSTQELAANNSVALMDSAGNIIDAVAWGGGTSQYVEGGAYPKNPSANQILSRKFVSGLMQDTESNSQDFEIR